MLPEPDQDIFEEDRVSKSQLKREMAALQDLGEELVRLPESRFRQMELPEKLKAAVIEARRLTAHGAIRRQMQYIGKVMRNVDPEPIRAWLESWKGQSRSAVDYHHQLERWRERLLEQPSALTELIELAPTCDAQRIRVLIRNAIRERENQRPPKAYRELFQVLKETFPEPKPLFPPEQ